MATITIPGGGSGSSLTKAAGSDINTGTDDAKYATSKAIADSNLAYLSDIPNIFSTVAVSGQSNVVADSTADTLTLAAGSGITITTNASTDTVTIAAAASGGITLVASQATTSGTSVTFTGIPSTAKRIAFMLLGVSISAGASSPPILIQLGISSGLETSGYNGVTVFQAASVDRLNWTSGIAIDTTAGAGAIYYGKVYLDLAVASSNTWAINGVVANPSSSSSFIGGTKALAGTLDRVAIIAPAGTTFDLGAVSISYE